MAEEKRKERRTSMLSGRRIFIAGYILDAEKKGGSITAATAGESRVRARERWRVRIRQALNNKENPPQNK